MRFRRFEWAAPDLLVDEIRDFLSHDARKVDVSGIAAEVAEKGDAALLDMTAKFDAPDAEGLSLRVGQDDALAALEALDIVLAVTGDNASAEDLQTEVYEIGKRHGFTNLRDWFKALYEVLLGQETGPRMGSFIALYGKAETEALIRRTLAGATAAA